MIDYAITILRLIESMSPTAATAAREALKRAAGDAKALEALHGQLARKASGGGWQRKQQDFPHTA